MPVTVKLSKRFYDRFGDDIANEFVNWFNDVDATYRADLVQMNDTNFVRFDAKLEQRLAEQDARIANRFAESDVRVERRFADFDIRIERRFAGFQVQIETRFAEFDVKLESRLSDLRSGMLSWMVGLWLTSMIAVTGMFVTLIRLR